MAAYVYPTMALYVFVLGETKRELSPPSWCWSPVGFLESHGSLVYTGRLGCWFPAWGQMVGTAATGARSRCSYQQGRRRAGKSFPYGRSWEVSRGTPGRPCPLWGSGFPFMLILPGDCWCNQTDQQDESWHCHSYLFACLSILKVIQRLLLLITTRLSDEEATQPTPTFGQLDSQPLVWGNQRTWVR